MYITCLDMEGVLVPEIWIEFARESGIPELTRTTRDEPDYDKLMQFRLDILARHQLGLKDIQQVIGAMGPLPGAREFLDALREDYEVIILSDTFYEFAHPLMRQQGNAPYRQGILIDQGLADQFLATQLHPHLFESACAQVGQPLTLRRHAGYDHGYYFIQSFIADHLQHHASALA